MKKYGLSIPIAGYVYIEIEAENEQQAIDKAFENGWEDEDVQELNMYEKLVQGNVCYVNHTRIDVEEIED